jgi:hypothetical protein
MNGFMKRTLEIPDPVFRQAKAAAAEQGIALREFITDAIAQKLRARASEEKAWMRSFGKLRGLGRETARINNIIEEEFERVDPEDLR